MYPVMRSSHYTVCELKCYYSWSLVIVKVVIMWGRSGPQSCARMTASTPAGWIAILHSSFAVLCMCSARKGSCVWYEANGLCEVQDIETISEILDPHRLDKIKRRLLFKGETVEMAAKREGVTVEWMNKWILEQYHYRVKTALGWVRQ